MRRILMTGGSGFIGGHFLARLQTRHDVVALGRSKPHHWSTPDLEWIEHDLRFPLDPLRLPTSIDTIIHLAQSQVYRQFPERAQEIFEVNVSGTLQLLEYARAVGASQFIFASSGGVYRLSREAIPESGAIEPLSFYLSTKCASEVLLRNYSQCFTTTVLRLFFVYGPGQQPGMLIPSMARRVRDGELITIEGDPGLRINPIHVDDVVRAIEASIETGLPGIVNVAGDDVVSITDLVEHIAVMTNKAPIIEHARAGADGDLVADTSHMKSALGVFPRVSLVDGLSSTLASMSPVSGR